jgi:diaminopimelate decarboxylase
MTDTKLEHYNFLAEFEIQDQCLVIGNKKITDILSAHKDNPVFLYDHNIIDNKIRLLKKYLPDEIKLHYAIKANPHGQLINHIAKQTDGLDVASGNELKLALESETRADAISFASPGKSDNDLLLAIRHGITINLESENEFNRVENLSRSIAAKANVALRINPDFELKTSGMKMSGGSKPFGVDEEIAPDLIKKITDSSLNFVGLHIYSGSQNLNAEYIIEAQTKTFSLAAKLSQLANTKFQQINIGGGFGIPYFPGEVALNIEPIGQHLRLLIREYSKIFIDTQFIIELGRFIVGECGMYICKIIDKKVSRGKTYLVVNGGLHHHLAASGNLGQVIRKNFPLTVVNKLGAETETVDVVGPLCTPLDILGRDMELPKADVGDSIAIFNSGAYGYSASPINFLSHPHPQEIFL